MDTETETLISVLRSRMEVMEPDERLELMRSIIDGYCKHCGYEDPDGRCQCQNDE